MSQDFNNAIAGAVADGWAVTSQTETTASLTRKAKFSWGFFILWLILVFLLGGLIYWIYWTSKKPETMFIEVTNSGEVRITQG